MIVLIDNYDSFTYNLYQIVANLDNDVRVIRNDAMTATEMMQLNPAGIIISPGPGRPENAGICVDLIQHCPSNIPILGVCLGHQAIVHAFGGTVVAAPTIVHGKSDLIFHEGNNLYQDLPLPFTAGRYHSLMAEQSSLPPCLLVEARNANGLIMGIRHKERPIFGVQFHPESILTPMGSRLLESFMRQCQQVVTPSCN